MGSTQFAWIMYVLGSVGCSLVAWWMFSWAWRIVRYSAVATVLIVLLLPYSIDKQEVILAPAIFTLVFDGIAQGKAAIEHPLKLMLGFWAAVEIIIGLFVFFTRHKFLKTQQSESENSTVRQKESRDTYEPEVRESLVHQDDLEHSEPLMAPIETQADSSLDQISSAADQDSGSSKPRKRPSVKSKSSVAGDLSQNETASDASAKKSPGRPKSKKSETSSKEEPIRATRD